MEDGKRGRPDKYLSNIKPHLEDIKRWAVYKTDAQIAKELGVAPQTFCGYKNKNPELVEALKRGRDKLVENIKNALIKRAEGFQYEEKVIVKKEGKIVREEIYTRTALPDVAAANLLLKNYDREFWRNDPAADEHKKEELKIQKKKLAAAEW